MKRTVRYDVGARALIILQFKFGRGGADLKPEEFSKQITGISKRLGCSREELLGFYRKFLVPEILCGCGLDIKQEAPKPSQSEVEIAFGLLELKFFWDLRGLRDEVYRIVERTPLTFEQVAGIVTCIATRHIEGQFGEIYQTKTEIPQ